MLGLELVLGLELGIELGLSTYIRGIRVKSNELKKQGRQTYIKYVRRILPLTGP